MKTKLLITLLLTLGLLTACSEMNPHPMDMSQAVQSATSKYDQEELADYYEKAANEMQVKVDEHKKLLDQYQSKSYLYGRQAEDLKAHCQELITVYEKAVVADRKMAEIHHKIAQ